MCQGIGKTEKLGKGHATFKQTEHFVFLTGMFTVILSWMQCFWLLITQIEVFFFYLYMNKKLIHQGFANKDSLNPQPPQIKSNPQPPPLPHTHTYTYSFLSITRWRALCSNHGFQMGQCTLMPHSSPRCIIRQLLWGWDRMAAILWMTFSNWFSLVKNCCVLIQVSLKFIPNGPINNKPTLVQIMVWHSRVHHSTIIWINDGQVSCHIWFNTLRLRQNGCHFPDDIFKCIFLNENAWISLKISLKFVPKVRIHNIPSLVQIMAWRRPGDKLLSEPMMVSLLTHICVTRPQWVSTNNFNEPMINTFNCNHGNSNSAYFPWRHRDRNVKVKPLYCLWNNTHNSSGTSTEIVSLDTSIMVADDPEALHSRWPGGTPQQMTLRHSTAGDPEALHSRWPWGTPQQMTLRHSTADDLEALHSRWPGGTPQQMTLRHSTADDLEALHSRWTWGTPQQMNLRHSTADDLEALHSRWTWGTPQQMTLRHSTADDPEALHSRWPWGTPQQITLRHSTADDPEALHSRWPWGTPQQMTLRHTTADDLEALHSRWPWGTP